MTAQQGYNGSGPHSAPYRDSEDEDIRAEVRGLKMTLGRFPDPLSGQGGSGICQFLYDLKRQQDAQKSETAGKASFLSTTKGRLVAIGLVFAFALTNVGSCVKLAVDWGALRAPAAARP